MPFVGIIAKESESNFIKNEVLKNSSLKFEFVNINRKSVQNVKNIRFETIIINNEISDFLNVSKYLEELIINAKYIIVNSDIIKNINILKQYNSNIITYGLNQKAMITISSIKNENILIFIQNKLKNINNDEIEEQEVNVKINKNSLKKVSNSMAIFTILLIYGDFLKKIYKKLTFYVDKTQKIVYNKNYEI